MTTTTSLGGVVDELTRAYCLSVGQITTMLDWSDRREWAAWALTDGGLTAAEVAGILHTEWSSGELGDEDEDIDAEYDDREVI